MLAPCCWLLLDVRPTPVANLCAFKHAITLGSLRLSLDGLAATPGNEGIKSASTPANMTPVSLQTQLIYSIVLLSNIISAHQQQRGV
jgi:hypothetical protein